MLENKEIVEKIRAICREKDTSITKLEEAVGWSNGYIGKWAKAKKRPPIEKLSIVAEHLDVPVFELTGTKNPDPQTGAGTMPPKEYTELNASNKAIVDRLIADLARSQSENLPSGGSRA